MNNKEIDITKLSIFFDGQKIHFGEVRQVEAGKWMFLGLDKNFANYLEKSEVNSDFIPNHNAVMILKDAIIGNAYGEDRNYGLENAGLDEMENQYINRLYGLGKIKIDDLKKHELILQNKIKTRMEAVIAEQMFLKSYNDLSAQMTEAEA